jgi:hypothetical protein
VIENDQAGRLGLYGGGEFFHFALPDECGGFGRRTALDA